MHKVNPNYFPIFGLMIQCVWWSTVFMLVFFLGELGETIGEWISVGMFLILNIYGLYAIIKSIMYFEESKSTASIGLVFNIIWIAFLYLSTLILFIVALDAGPR